MISANLGPVLKAIERKRNPQKPPHTLVVERLSDKTNKATETLLKAISDVDVNGPLSALEARLIQSMIELGVHINTLTDAISESVKSSRKDILSNMPGTPDFSGIEGELNVALKEIEALKKAVVGIKMPDMPPLTDLGPIEQRLEALERRMNEPRRFDFDIKRDPSLPGHPIAKVVAKSV